MVLAVAVAVLLWSLFYVFTHKGNSADPYYLLRFQLLDDLFIWGLSLSAWRTATFSLLLISVA